MFSDFLMFNRFFLSPQVKQGTIITYKHGKHELLYKLSNHQRFRVLGN